MKYIFAGDSWAEKAYNESNYNQKRTQQDQCLADFLGQEYMLCALPGESNLDVLDRIKQLDINPVVPIVWVYTEPGRDYGRITGQDKFDWLRSEDFHHTRKQLEPSILSTIRTELSNPIALIGGLADVNILLAESLGFYVLCSSWQQWIAHKLNSKHFIRGWAASDVGWRMHYNNVVPSREATFAWDEQIKEWCWWAEQGYFCHEHPTLKANTEFADYLRPKFNEWIANYE